MRYLEKAMKKIILITGLILASSISFAQTAPDSTDPGAIERSIQQDIRQIPQEQQKGKVETRGKVSPEKKEETIKTDAGLVYNPKFTLDRVVFEGNTLLDEEELQELTKELTGTEIYISDLINLAMEVTRRYQQKGYASSFAYIPQQKIDSGEAVIKVVESKVAQINIKGNKWARKTYLKDIVLRKNGIKEDEVFNIRSLRPALDELNQKNYIKGQIAIEEGKSPDLTEITLEVKDRLPLNFNFRWDNEGRRLVGKQRAIFYAGSENLTGFGDSLYGASVLANGTVGALAGYKIPVGPYGTEFQFDYSYSHVQLGKEFKLNRVTGYSHNYSPKLVQSLYKSYNTDISTDLGFDFITSKSRQNDIGALINKYNLRVLRNGIDLKRYDSQGLWVSRIENSFGLDALGATDNFYKLYTELARYQRLPWDSIGIFKIAHQYTPDNLFAAEQFQLGGASSVRGFEPGLALGDVGFNASIEARTPVPFLKTVMPESKEHWADKLKLGFFYDFGFYNSGQYAQHMNQDNFLQSVGVGFHLNLIKGMTASFDIGVPIGANSLEGQDVRLHFSLGADVHRLFLKEPELL